MGQGLRITTQVLYVQPAVIKSCRGTPAPALPSFFQHQPCLTLLTSLLQVQDVGQQACLVLRAHGPSLHTLLRSHFPNGMPTADCKHVAAQLLAALQAVHEQQVWTSVWGGCEQCVSMGTPRSCCLRTAHLAVTPCSILLDGPGHSPTPPLDPHPRFPLPLLYTPNTISPKHNCFTLLADRPPSGQPAQHSADAPVTCPAAHPHPPPPFSSRDCTYCRLPT